MPAGLRAALSRSPDLRGYLVPISSRAMNASAPDAQGRHRYAVGRRRFARSSCRACAPPRRATSTRPSRRCISSPPPAPASCASRSTTRRKSPRSTEIRRADRRRHAVGRPAGELPRGGLGRALGRQDPLQPRPPPPHRARASRSPTRSAGWRDVARDNDCAVRIGVNCGSVAPEFLERYPGDQLEAIVQSALYHCDLMERLGFDRFVVSLKDSDPDKVVAANSRFAEARPDVPLHLGVTEAGHAARGHHQEPARLREAARRAASATRSASR